MRSNIFTRVLAALAVVALAALPAAAQPVFFQPNLVSYSGFVGSAGTAPCMLIKYVGSTAGVADVAVAAGGDMTLRIAGSADTTTGSAANGVWDLSTPAATVDTMGELVTLLNTTGSNWRAVLVGCLAADLTDNAIATLTTAEANGPAGVALYRDSAVASATSVFSSQVALVPAGAATDISFWLAANKVNPNPFAGFQTFVQHIREKITSSGTVALFEVLAVKRSYAGAGTITETTRTLYAETGANTTVEKVLNFHNGPIVAAPGELIVVRQRTATDLTAETIGGSAYAVKVGDRR